MKRNALSGPAAGSLDKPICTSNKLIYIGVIEMPKIALLLLLPICMTMNYTAPSHYIPEIEPGISIYTPRTDDIEVCYNFQKLVLVNTYGVMLYNGAEVNYKCEGCFISVDRMGLGTIINPASQLIEIESTPSIIAIIR